MGASLFVFELCQWSPFPTITVNLCLTSSGFSTIVLLAVKRELGMESIKSGLLSFTRVASDCEGLSFSPDVICLI